MSSSAIAFAEEKISDNRLRLLFGAEIALEAQIAFEADFAFEAGLLLKRRLLWGGAALQRCDKSPVFLRL
jgi:hypothetical protein